MYRYMCIYIHIYLFMCVDMIYIRVCINIYVCVWVWVCFVHLDMIFCAQISQNIAWGFLFHLPTWFRKEFSPFRSQGSKCLLQLQMRGAPPPVMFVGLQIRRGRPLHKPIYTHITWGAPWLLCLWGPEAIS